MTCGHWKAGCREVSNLRKLLAGSDLPVTVAHERWLAKNSSADYSDKAIEFAQKALSQEVGGSRNRTTMFRSSSVGSCERRQVYRGVGTEEKKVIDGKLANIFHTGNFLHLKWQMAGITAGWLVEAEVSADREDLNFGGTLDGIIVDGSGFEFKSINARGFSQTETYGPKKDHIHQVHAYMLLRPDIKEFSIVYENKDSGEWREFRVNRDQATIDEISENIRSLNKFVIAKELPQIKSKCLEQEGYEYRGCPFRDRCLSTDAFPTKRGPYIKV